MRYYAVIAPPSPSLRMSKDGPQPPSCTTAKSCLSPRVKWYTCRWICSSVPHYEGRRCRRFEPERQPLLGRASRPLSLAMTSPPPSSSCATSKKPSSGLFGRFIKSKQRSSCVFCSIFHTFASKSFVTCCVSVALGDQRIRYTSVCLRPPFRATSEGRPDCHPS